MAAPADASKRAEVTRRARRAEKAPSGGWRTIAAKEMADHLASTRFFVLLVVVAVAAIVPLLFVSNDITSQAPTLSGAPALFLALFVVGSKSIGSITTVLFVGLLVPLVGIAFGFDGINAERNQGTLSRLLAQPIHRDDVVNGKFVAGLAVIGLVLASVIAFIAGFGMLRLGIVPHGSEVLRLVAWVVVTFLYVALWLAFGLLLSVLIRRAATAALIGFGVWLLVTIFGGLITNFLGSLVAPAANASPDQILSSLQLQELISRFLPTTLYNDVSTALLSPSTALVGLPGTIGQVQQAQQQIPALLTLDQSILLVWPEVVVIVALAVFCFAAAYVAFMRQEVRA
jgi:ABC-2 type transport system permease protein